MLFGSAILAGLRREEVLSQRYRVLDGPETDASTVQQLWLAVHDSREITVELVCARTVPCRRTPSGFHACAAPSWQAVSMSCQSSWRNPRSIQV